MLRVPILEKLDADALFAVGPTGLGSYCSRKNPVGVRVLEGVTTSKSRGFYAAKFLPVNNPNFELAHAVAQVFCWDCGRLPWRRGWEGLWALKVQGVGGARLRVLGRATMSYRFSIHIFGSRKP